MKTTYRKEVEVEIKTILIDINIRYVGDSDDDDVPTDFPLLNGSVWQARVDVDTGKIEGWPAGKTKEMFCKVCDQGVYTLYDDENNVITVKDGYVPNGIVPGEYGDYVDLKINREGIITNWPASPDLSSFFEDED